MSLSWVEDLTSQFVGKSAEVSYDRERDRLIVDARDSSICDNDIQMLAERKTLVYLNVSNTSVTNQSLAYLAKCARLEFIDLSRTMVDLHCLDILSSHVELKGIGLSEIFIGAHIAALLRFPKLEILDLSRTSVTVDAVRTLLQHTAVSSVDLQGNGLLPTSFEDLDILDDDSRTVSVTFDDGVRLAIAMLPLDRRPL
jgi:hypothetical protein